ncbi:HAD family phosphatase [Salicibibacter cibarius]|uniref:HAD family phosphatase n=1 Tax=Salicibibacter cibarius TaxID=2743000 RepID=A0A7T7CB56_9BACI|nr:HAD family hydrolase [Salicibibacter cibarius]QQK75614.1 HAD family phosphatase [Salicibibacter cibarius]
MNYRLLALAVDGAILKDNSRLSRTTKEAIEFVRNKGVYATLVTHRSYQQANKIAKALRMEHEMICYGGALIAGRADKPLYAQRMPVEMARDITFELERFGCQIVVEHENFELTNRLHQPQNLLGKMTVSVSESLFYPQTVVEHMSEHIDLHRIAPLRMKVDFDANEEKEAAINHLQSIIPGLSVVEQEGDIPSVHLKMKEANKSETLLYLGHELGIHPEEMVAVAAKTEDEEMLNAVGLGVAMGQSSLHLRKSADWVTRSNDQDGLAYMIKEVFRKQMNVSQQHH